MLNFATIAKNFRIRIGRFTSEPDLSMLALGLAHPNGTLVGVPDKGGRIAGEHACKSLTEDFSATDTADQIAILTATGLVRATTANLLHHIYTPGGNIFGNCALGTQTLPPVIVANGLDIGGDQTNAEGYEVFSNFAGASGRPFVVGSDPAFYFQAKVLIGDASGTDTMLIGFRRAEVNNGTLANYADYAGIGVSTSANPAALKVITEINAGGATVTDTTQTLADATALTVRVNVSAAGVITYKLLVGTAGQLAAPTVTAAATLDDGDPVIPFIHFLNAADITDTFVIQTWEVGFQ